MQVFETQQQAALVVEGSASGGMLRLCEVHVLGRRGSFLQLLERTDACLVYVVKDTAASQGTFGAAPTVVVHSSERADSRALVELYPDPSSSGRPASRALDPDEEGAMCMRLLDLCLELKQDIRQPGGLLQQTECWQQRRHRELAESYCEQRAALLDMVMAAMEAQLWLCSADANVTGFPCATTGLCWPTVQHSTAGLDRSARVPLTTRKASNCRTVDQGYCVAASGFAGPFSPPGFAPASFRVCEAHR